MTAVGDKLYIFGGQDPHTGATFNDVVMCDPGTKMWNRVPVSGSPPPRHSHTACCFQGHRILIYGGAGEDGPVGDIWVFDTELSEWSRPIIKGQAPAPREMHCGVDAGAHGLVIFGGRTSGGEVLSDLHVLNTESLAWGPGLQTPFARCAHAGGSVGSLGQVYFFGGFSGDGGGDRGAALQSSYK
eukprot:CAMPEP_0196590534 /NCGR_PEP_ID=MMETSP1081-20130531/66885_1 /TAXON_ID=36882 /ORGANISM="Pyramimonas amylifera, Strain CCMP720" /LENGTH=184 /DNA_ID=CAMNT_0041913673 /DNA_START=245 /DNA_END=798 /DNA_ORIENTATION=-